MQCLKDMGVQFLYTPSIQLDENVLQLLKSERRVIVFGHIDYLPKSATYEQKKIKASILEILYYKSDLVMPTRNPSNLLQSWMHYAKTRSNRILQNISNNKALLYGNDAGMLANMSPLRQDCLVFSDDLRTISRGKDFPDLELNEEDEEWNLLAFASFLRQKSIAQMCSMQYELFRIYWASIEGHLRKGERFDLELPESDKKRSVIYYDCENLGSGHQDLLDKAICSGFSEKLINTRRNASDKKSNRTGCEFESVNKLLRNNFLSEWRIYEKSKDA